MGLSLASHIRRSLVAASALAALLAVGAVPAVAQEGAKVFVASDGDVIATYLGNSASYSNDLYLDSPANLLGLIFNNHASPVGSTKNLGFFTAGTELIFRLHVNNTGDDFFTGPGDRNPDDHAHALVENFATETRVHFEDLFGGAFVYNDLSFSFTNTRTTEVPEPGTLAFLGAGLVGTGVFIRRKRA